MILYCLGRLGVAPRFSANRIVVGCQLTRNDLRCSLQKPVKVFQVQWNRSFSTNHCIFQISTSLNRNENLALSRPRLFKQYQSERAEDKLPDEWDLIFAQGNMKRKIKAALWSSFAVLCCLPFAAVYCWWEYRNEEDVILFNQQIRKTTELMLLIALQVFLFTTLYKNFQRVPLRIYFNQSKDRYMAIRPSKFPWIYEKVEFKSMDISKVSLKIPTIKLKGAVYLVHNTKFMFPYTFFRNGEDRSWMLRRIDMRKI